MATILFGPVYDERWGGGTGYGTGDDSYGDGNGTGSGSGAGFHLGHGYGRGHGSYDRYGDYGHAPLDGPGVEGAGPIAGGSIF